MSTTATVVRPINAQLTREPGPLPRTVPRADPRTIKLSESPVPAAIRWFHRGVRKVTLPDVVDLAAGTEEALRALLLVRELTSLGIAVDWRLRLDGRAADAWRAYSHLHPPAELLAPAGEPTWGGRVGEVPPVGGSTMIGLARDLAVWGEKFFLDKCAYRRGPGFVQIRDRRAGRLSLITIDDPRCLAVMKRLDGGVRSALVDPTIVRDFDEEKLIGRIGDFLLWLPYRIRRWPLPALGA